MDELNMSPFFGALTENQVHYLHARSLELLERTGVVVKHDIARTLLRQNGAAVDQERVFLPERLIRETMCLIPKKCLIYDRTGNLSMRLENREAYFGTGSDTHFLHDVFTGARRKWTEADVEQGALIADSLENIDFIMSMGLISDRPVWLTDMYQFSAMLRNSLKPIVYTSHNRTGLEGIARIASAVSGSAENLRRKPFLIHYVEPSTPLLHTKDAVDKLLFHADTGLPLIYASGPIAGAMTPITPASAIVLAWAEILSGNAIAQLKGPGTPLIVGSSFSVIDMKTGVLRHCSPAANLQNVVFNQLCKAFGFPNFTVGGVSDSKLPDAQAAIESTLTIVLAALSGGNLIHDVAYLESGMAGSFEMLIAENETIGRAREFINGPACFDDSAFLDPTAQVLQFGQEKEGQIREMERTSELAALTQSDQGQQECLISREQCRQKLESILQSHRVVEVPGEVDREIKSIIDSLAAAYGRTETGNEN